MTYRRELTRVTYDFLSGEESTDLTTLYPQVIGVIFFDPNSIIPVTSGRIRHVEWDVTIETSIITRYARIELYDITGVFVGGLPGVVTAATKQTTSLAPTRYVQNLDPIFGSTTAAGLLEARLSLQDPGPGFATCKGVQLVVTWE
jgi:hypothetical protein